MSAVPIERVPSGKLVPSATCSWVQSVEEAQVAGAAALPIAQGGERVLARQPLGDINNESRMNDDDYTLPQE